jgi:energy-coupling factor transport system substrate-specific component
VEEEMKKKKKWLSSVDLLMIAVIAAIGAVLSSLVINPIVRALNIASPFVSMWPGALHLFAVIMGGLIVRKPGATMFTALLNGLLQMLFGNPSGALCILYGFGNGLGSEIAFSSARYRPKVWITMLASGCGTVTAFFIDLIYWFSDFTFGFKVLYLVDSFFAGSIVCGLISWGVFRALERAGVVNRK